MTPREVLAIFVVGIVLGFSGVTYWQRTTSVPTFVTPMLGPQIPTRTFFDV